ncbi:MAG: V-type ATP synthase subunit F [Candidatus Altiarchaeota archaeon]
MEEKKEQERFQKRISIHFIGDKNTSQGFRLAGLINSYEYSKENEKTMIEKIIAVGGIVAISNKLKDALKEEIPLLQEKGLTTVIVPDETGGEEIIESYLSKGGVQTFT